MAEVELAEKRKGGVKGHFLMQGRSHSTDGGWDGENAGRSKFIGGKEGAEKSEATLPASFKVTGPASSKRL